MQPDHRGEDAVDDPLVVGSITRFQEHIHRHNQVWVEVKGEVPLCARLTHNC